MKNWRYVQYLSAISASILLANTTMYVVWVSVTQIDLLLGNTPLGPIKHTQVVGLYSILVLGTAVGAVISGLIVDKLSRKISLLLCAILLFVPWIITAFAKSVTFLLIGRFIAGMASSVALVAAVSYNGEIAEKDNRGKIGMASSIAIIIGNIFMLGLKPSVTYSNLALSCSAFPLLFALLFFFMPESPYYLVKIGQKDVAYKNLLRLSKGSDNDIIIKRRLEEIEESVTYDIQNSAFLNGYSAKCILVMLGITTLQAFSGTIILEDYGMFIIKSNSKTMTFRVSYIIFGLLQIISCFIVVTLVDIRGRKPLLKTSAFGCAVLLIAEAIYVVSTEREDYIPELATTLLVLHVLFNGIGAYSLPNVLMGELFAVNNKGAAMAVITFYQVALKYLLVRFFAPTFFGWKSHILWISAAFSVLGGVFVVPTLLETKNKTFMEIRQQYSDEKSGNKATVRVPQVASRF